MDGQMLFLFFQKRIRQRRTRPQASVHNEVDGFADDLTPTIDAPGQSVRPKWILLMIKERLSTMLAGGTLLLFTAVGNAEDIDANSFRCITKMTPVRQFYVDNLRGELDATLAAANSAKGAIYPAGSVLQLIPTEVMVKRSSGFDATTHDWEFFFLEVSKDGARINNRGTTDVVNQLGGN